MSAQPSFTELELLALKLDKLADAIARQADVINNLASALVEGEQMEAGPPQDIGGEVGMDGKLIRY